MLSLDVLLAKQVQAACHTQTKVGGTGRVLLDEKDERVAIILII